MHYLQQEKTLIVSPARSHLMQCHEMPCYHLTLVLPRKVGRYAGCIFSQWYVYLTKPPIQCTNTAIYHPEAAFSTKTQCQTLHSSILHRESNTKLWALLTMRQCNMISALMWPIPHVRWLPWCSLTFKYGNSTCNSLQKLVLHIQYICWNWPSLSRRLMWAFQSNCVRTCSGLLLCLNTGTAVAAAATKSSSLSEG